MNGDQISAPQPRVTAGSRLLLQGVGDRMVEDKERDSSHFWAMMNSFSFGTSDTCSLEDHLKITAGQMIHTLIQYAGTRWLKQKSRR